MEHQDFSQCEKKVRLSAISFVFSEKTQKDVASIRAIKNNITSKKDVSGVLILSENPDICKSLKILDNELQISNQEHENIK